MAVSSGDICSDMATMIQKGASLESADRTRGQLGLNMCSNRRMMMPADAMNQTVTQSLSRCLTPDLYVYGSLVPSAGVVFGSSLSLNSYTSTASLL